MAVFDDPWNYFFGQQDAQLPNLDELKRQSRAPLAPADQDTLLNKLVGGGMSGLHFAGSTLDKLFGGRAIRSGLQGLGGGEFHPRELLSVLPGSDITGLTDESQRVSGEDVAKTFGLLDGPGTKGEFEARDLVGPAIEAATDPGTYLTFGASAATKAGQAAKRIGALPGTAAGRIRGYGAAEDVAKAMGLPLAEAGTTASRVGINLNDLLNKPLGGLAGLRVPFAGGETSVLGTGSAAQTAADLMGKVGDKLAYSGPGRFLSAAFDPTVRGRTDATFQRVARETEAADQVRRSGLRAGITNVADELFNLDRQGQRVPPESLRAALEGVPDQFVGPHLPAVSDALERTSSLFRPADDAALRMAQDAGVNVRELQSLFDTGHASRFATPVPQGTGQRSGVPRERLGTKFGPTLQREPILDVLGGTPEVNRMVRDPRIGTSARVPVDLSGNPIPRLTADAPGAQQAVQQIMAAFQQFPEALTREMLDLKASGADPARLALLQRQYKASNVAARRGIEENLLGAQPGEVSRTARRVPSQLQTLSALNETGPMVMHPDAIDEFRRLSELRSESDYLARRIYPLRNQAAAGMWSNPADELIPALNTARQDRAAERTIRGPDFFNLPEPRLDELRGLRQQAAGQGKDALAQWLGTAEGEEFSGLAHQDKTAGPLARYLGQLDPARQQLGLFGNDPMADTLRGWESLAESSRRAELATGYLGQTAQHTRTPDPGMVPVRDLLKSVGLTQQAEANLLAGLAGRGQSLRTNDVRNLFVSPEQAQQVKGLFPLGDSPSFLDPAIQGYDSLTNLFKSNVTSPWPSFHARNLLSSTWQNLTHGAGLGEATSMAALRSGEAIKGAADIPYLRSLGLTDEQATSDLGKLMFAERAAGAQALHPLRETAGLSSAGDSLAAAVPGVRPQPGLQDILTGKSLDTDAPLKSLLNPLNVEGFGGRNVTTYLPAQAGRQLGNLVDDVTRGGGFLDLMKQGYTPQAAADVTKAAHFDYSNLTDFERRYLKRLMPFYGYTSKVVPQQLGQLAGEPGGLTGQAIRVATGLRQQEGFLPPYLGGGLAIPAGGEDDTGNRRYLTKLDLPFEQPLEMLSTGPGGLSKTLMKTLGQLNPLIKGPLELATNRQFYSGRELDDLYSRTGVPALDQVVMNSPFSKMLTTFGTLTDPRKWADPLAIPVNLLTGARLSDVDLNKQRLTYGPQAVEEMLKGRPGVKAFENLYVPDQNLPLLSPEELLLLRLYRSLEHDAGQAAKQRKAPVG